MENEPSEIYTCAECGSSIKSYHRFCHNCGAWLGSNSDYISIFNNNNLQSAFFFYIIYLLICLIVQYTDWFDSYNNLFWIEVLLAAITVFFARANWQNIKPALRFRNFKWKLLLIVIVSAILFSVVVNLTVNQLNISLFNTDIGFYDRFKIYHFPILTMIYSIAINPALFEELAFRGILYNYLNMFLDERMVVLVTGFAFAAIHLNFFSLFWLIPFGILLGVLRKRYQTIWYGVILHFTFNLVSCLFDLYRHGEL